MEVEPGKSGNSSEIDTGMPGISRGILERQDIVLGVRVSIKNNVVPDLGNIESPIHLRLVVAWHGVELRINYAEETSAKVPGGKRIATQATDHASASESQFQKWKQSEVDLLTVHKWIWNVWVPVKTSEELVNPDGTKVPQQTWKKKGLWIYQANHGYRLDVVTPHHRTGSGSPGKTLPAKDKLPVVQVHGRIRVE